MAAVKITIITPPQAEKSYVIAGKTFGDLWEKVTGVKPRSKSLEHHLPEGNLVLIGSDAVNPIVHELIKRNKIKELIFVMAPMIIIFYLCMMQTVLF
ncbi:MAG: hypothetical protein COY53_02680 [Elusimicrobia bacterium CG_4_10_14_0_8_um_filter_37_32]|nr:MAG: hypothetical protein COS17_08215 [Elusimicrobia bacterium CG02_land_8_20_14_3_00_37_13]PIZ13858.1 MAG: hypothetical protein COY53_02680 [Elusimicrobia bacterium CG_4_10_14_0_8_um_filter_37_32]